ncbi:hypothetical protein GQ43DRAFT_469515 [Delitschia confertaspora ATCC 74209]|uniref:Uncharacterized protein n=1 Tax=Delitschia confertaspora ATCC 74209 TaxID=1513339 RepID=A0A9P4JRN1_9PLEO|nr:hypothetical protein GQ43DRAFT_469515 [Delitschia confertaspora ATCC 74209]
MPSLPFSAPSSPTKTTPSPPSIVLSPSTGSPSSPRQLYQSKDQIASAYRLRYAQYLAATFNMSLEAAMAEADVQLAPRRSSGVSEAEALRES